MASRLGPWGVRKMTTIMSKDSLKEPRLSAAEKKSSSPLLCMMCVCAVVVVLHCTDIHTK